jgi:hypothetical protein
MTQPTNTSFNLLSYKNSTRPLKCRLCWRRFKYSSCLGDHMKSDHKETIQLLLNLKQAQIRARKQQEVRAQLMNIIRARSINKPVRVSVITSNFHPTA